MPIEPTGILSGPLANCRTLIAACAAWQSWCEKESAEAAATRVHLFDLPVPAQGDGQTYEAEELTAKRPCARILYYSPPSDMGGQPWQYARVAQGAYRESGKLMVDFLADVDPSMADDPAGVMIDFTNHLGAVWEQMLELGGGDTEFLCIHAVELFEGPHRCDQVVGVTQGDFCQAKLLIHYGT